MSDSLDQETASDALYPVTFMATIKLSKKEIVEAEGVIGQAIQNQIGGSGASVIEVVSV